MRLHRYWAVSLAAATLLLCTSCVLNTSRLNLSGRQLNALQNHERDRILSLAVVRHALYLSADTRDDRQEREIATYLNAMAGEILQLTQKRSRYMNAAELTRHLEASVALPDFASPRPFTVEVDYEEPRPLANAFCDGGELKVVVSAPLLRSIALGSFNYGAGKREFRDRGTFLAFLRRLAKGAPANLDGVVGWGAMFSVFSHLAGLTAPVSEGEREYVKSVSFLLAHEAAHLWAHQCKPSVEEELGADLQGVVYSFEVYVSRCSEKITPLGRGWNKVKREGGGTSTVSVNGVSNLWGRRGIEMIQQIYEGDIVIERDENHVPFDQRMHAAAAVGDAIESGMTSEIAFALENKWFGLFRNSTLALSTKSIRGMPCPYGEISDGSQ